MECSKLLVGVAALGAVLSVPGVGWAQTCTAVYACGDVDGSGTVVTTDAQRLLRKAVGQDVALTCECALGGGDCESSLAAAQAQLLTCNSDLSACEGESSACTSDLVTCDADLSACEGESSACASDLATCDGDLSTCEGQSSACTASLGECQSDLGTCESDLLASAGTLSNCQTDLSTTNADLSDCLAAPICGNSVIEDGEDCEVAVVVLGHTCLTEGDFKGGVLGCGPGCQFDTSRCYEERYVSNGSTIVDLETRLEWELKNGSDNLTDYANPRDVDNVYSWSASGTSPGGSVFTDFLGKLNGADDGTPHAGRSDWRLPTQAELASIAKLSPLCTIAPCVANKVFLPNRSAIYWTSDTDLDPTKVRGVNFVDGLQPVGLKTGFTHARAVRAYGAVGGS